MSRSFVFEHSDDAREHFFEIPELPRPPATRTQWLCFRFRSQSMQRHSPASHFAIALAARLERDANGRPCSLSGRGLALGDTSAATAPPNNRFAHAPGFGGGRGVQVESFWPGGNFLYRNTGLLAAGLSDGVDYAFHLHVTVEGQIGFWIAEIDGKPPLSPLEASVLDRAEHPVSVPATGIVIALGRAPQETGAWSARFSELNYGWF